jgi:hypothetical protein
MNGFSQPKPPEAASNAPQTVENPALTPDQQKAEVQGGTRLGLAEIKQEMESGNTKIKEMEEKAKGLRTNVSWMANTAEEISATDFGAHAIPGAIEAGFDDDIKAKLKEFGFGDENNIAAIKAVAKEIALEHYKRTGKSAANTKSYLESEFKQNLLSVTENLKKLYESNKDKIKSPAEGIEMFAQYCGIQFIKNGTLQPKELKQLLLLDKTMHEQLSTGFVEYFNLKEKQKSLSSQAAETVDDNIKPEELVESIQLKTKLQIIIGPEGFDKQISEIKAKIIEQLPENLSAANKEKYADSAIEQLKQKNPQPGEGRELDTSGKWSENIDPKTFESETIQDAAKEAVEDFKTGNALIDGILGFVKMISPDLFASITALLKGLNFGKAPEKVFEGLSAEENKSANKFINLAATLKLEQENIDRLTKDKDQFKKVIANRKKEDLTWEKYVEKYLTQTEIDELKMKNNLDTDSAEKIVNIFLTPVNPEATDATDQPETAPENAGQPAAPPAQTPPSA